MTRGCKGVTFSILLLSSMSKARTCLPLLKALSTYVSLIVRRSLFFSLPTPALILWIWLAAKGFKTSVSLSTTKEWVFLNPSCTTCLSNCQGCPKRMWQALVGTTLQRTLSLYFFLIEKEIRDYLVTLMSPLSLSHFKV